MAYGLLWRYGCYPYRFRCLKGFPFCWRCSAMVAMGWGGGLRDGDVGGDVVYDWGYRL